MGRFSAKRKKGAALQAERPKRVGYWKASVVYDKLFNLPCKQELLSEIVCFCSAESISSLLPHFCELFTKRIRVLFKSSALWYNS